MSKRYKKHNIEDRIKYIKMIEEGYSKDYIVTAMVLTTTFYLSYGSDIKKKGH